MSTKLNPTVTTKAKSIADQEGRKRPVVAINEEGKLVVCCRRTAKKNGWELQGTLHKRSSKAVEPAPEPVKVVKAKKAKAADTAVDDILGK